MENRKKYIIFDKFDDSKIDDFLKVDKKEIAGVLILSKNKLFQLKKKNDFYWLLPFPFEYTKSGVTPITYFGQYLNRDVANVSEFLYKAFSK